MEFHVPPITKGSAMRIERLPGERAQLREATIARPATMRQYYVIGGYGAIDTYRYGCDSRGEISREEAEPVARRVSMGP